MEFNAEQVKLETGVKVIHNISVESEHGDLNAYLRTPKLTELDLFLHTMQTDYAVAVRNLVDKLWLGGDEEIRTSDVEFQALAEQLIQLFQETKVTYKKVVKNFITTYNITVTDSSDEDAEKVLTCSVRHPKLEELAAQSERNPMISFQKLLTKLWVNGDVEIRTNVLYLFPVMSQWRNIMEKRVTSVKKL